MSGYAPVVLFVYNRIDEPLAVLSALANNKLAKKTDIYVFSNAPIPEKNEKDKIEILRKEVIKFQGDFNHFELIKREKNDGVNGNMLDGIDRVINKYGRVIVLEDDILPCRSFLEYMNKALDFYENDDEIYTICGYNPAKADKENNADTFAWRIFKCWGWGTWLNRWKKFDFEENLLPQVDLYTARHHDVQLSEVLQNDIVYMENKHYDTLDYKILCRQLSLGKLSIYPKKSLCDNIGLNGSGISGTVSESYCNDNFDMDFTQSEFIFLKTELTIYNDPNLFKNFRRKNCLFDFYNRGMYRESLYKNLYYCAARACCYSNYFGDYFIENKISSISIYGYGGAGKLLHEMLAQNINIAYLVDNKMEPSDKVFNSVNNLPPCDLIVVTPVFDFYCIEENLMETNPNIKVVSMFDLVINMMVFGQTQYRRESKNECGFS